METFEAVKFCENLLKSYDSVSLVALDQALIEVRIKLELERDECLESIGKVQQSVQDKGGMDIVYKLLDRQAKASKGLESARLMVKEVNSEYAETSRILEEKEMQRKNAILLRDLVIELDHYNVNQGDIDIDPKHLIYLKHSLEVMDIPEYNTVTKK